MTKTLSDYGQFDQVSLLTDGLDAKGLDYPNKKNIETKLLRMLEHSQPEDFFLFFFSGHGISDDDKKGYILPVDTDTENLVSSAVSIEWVVDKIKEFHITKSILILDACRDNPTKGKKSASVNNLKNEENYYSIACCSKFYRLLRIEKR